MLDIKKAEGPGEILGLRGCIHQVVQLVTGIFNLSVSHAAVPTRLKQATIIPVAEPNNITCLNDYRTITAYRAPLSTEDYHFPQHSTLGPVRDVCEDASSLTASPCTEANQKESTASPKNLRTDLWIQPALTGRPLQDALPLDHLTCTELDGLRHQDHVLMMYKCHMSPRIKQKFLHA